MNGTIEAISYRIQTLKYVRGPGTRTTFIRAVPTFSLAYLGLRPRQNEDTLVANVPCSRPWQNGATLLRATARHEQGFWRLSKTSFYVQDTKFVSAQMLRASQNDSMKNHMCKRALDWETDG